MKKTVIITCLMLLLSACALSPRKTHIAWPDRIDYIEALCDIDMSWKDMQYSGAMSLKMKYPYRLQIEIYGPFGETAVYLAKDRDRFSFITRDENLSDEKSFEERFGIKLLDFIDDISAGHYSGNSRDIFIHSKRASYVVIYKLDNIENSICWKGRDGNICVRFLEASFDEKG